MIDRHGSLPRWVVIWFALSIPIVIWDVSFVLLRPMSMPGGSLGFLWIPYEKYITVDLSYGDLDNGFVRAQAIMSCIEVAIGIAALIHSARRHLPLATLLAFCASALTCAKTMLIGMIELVTGFEHVGHNTVADVILLYAIPNGLWIVVPLLVVWTTGRRLVDQQR